MKKEKSKKVPTKRMSLKKIVAILGISLISFLAFVGCGSYSSGIDAFEKGNDLLHKNEYIVVSENGVETLHHGSYKTENSDQGRISIGSAVPILKFDCGEIISTSQFVSYINKKPDATKYDKICHDCFPDEEHNID